MDGWWLIIVRRRGNLLFIFSDHGYPLTFRCKGCRYSDTLLRIYYVLEYFVVVRQCFSRFSVPSEIVENISSINFFLIFVYQYIWYIGTPIKRVPLNRINYLRSVLEVSDNMNNYIIYQAEASCTYGYKVSTLLVFFPLEHNITVRTNQIEFHSVHHSVFNYILHRIRKVTSTN